MVQSASLDQACAIAKELGYHIRGLDISLAEGAVEIRRVSKIDDQGEVLSLDLLLVTPQVQDVWERKEAINFLGTQLFVVSRQGLIMMKQLAGRPQDLIDIEELENEAS